MFLKIIALQLSFDVHPLEFSVEEPDVVALPLLPQQHVLAKDILQNNKTHVTQTVTPRVEVFPSLLIQVLVADVASMLTKASLSCQFAGANVLHHTFLACYAVNNSRGLAI